MHSALLDRLKQWALPANRSARRVPFGLYRGLSLQLDLHTDSQLYVGLAERETHPFIRHAAARATWMIDVGAGRGELSLYFLARTHANPIHAFEPGPDAVVLEQNVARRRSVGRVVVHRAFAGKDAPLDALPLDRSRRGFVKIDVEGAELAVLESGRALLGAGQVDVLVEVHSRSLERDCLAWLSARGYRTAIIPNAWWRRFLPEHRSIPHNRWIVAVR